MPTSLLRDGGFPAGHLATLDGRPLVLLDPSHLLEARERDALVPLGHIKAVKSALPQAHVEIWPRMGHHPQRERPAQLSRFIERHAAEAAAPATRTESARRG